jgi:hypothetical protein
MSTQAQIDANRANAQNSTGPKTDEGKAKSSANARRHGLLSASGAYFTEAEQRDYEELENNLLKECLPGSELEHQAFLRYAFNTYQVMRAQRLEVEAQDNFLDNPGDEKYFAQMERMVKITGMLERRADKALNELRRLQRDRISALDIHNELYLLEKKVPLPLTLPVAEMRKTKQSQTSPFVLAMMALNTTPEARSIVENQTKPNGVPHVTATQIAELARQQGR